MQRAHARPMYTGYPAARPLGLVGHHHHHGAPGHGFCAGCGHPRSSCCCGCRECRKESRELLVEPTQSRAQIQENPDARTAVARMSMLKAFSDTMEGADASAGTAAENAPVHLLNAETLKAGAIGLGTAFIGGGCCVHLSIEYTPSGTADGIVGVLVQEGNDTQLLWLKRAAAGLGYQIKECIVTTKPGAHLTALAVGATARVRWCEVFSC